MAFDEKSSQDLGSPGKYTLHQKIKVFISHASEDREFVENELIPILNKHGIGAWHSNAEIVGADDWQMKIYRALQECEWFIVVLSSSAIGSDWVKAEVNWALKRRQNKIVPILRQACDVDKLDLRLDLIQGVDYQISNSNSRNELLRVWGISLSRNNN